MHDEQLLSTFERMPLSVTGLVLMGFIVCDPITIFAYGSGRIKPYLVFISFDINQKASETALLSHS